MKNFESLTLPASLLSSIKTMGFKEPTPIQAKTIPLSLEGKDVLGTANTGTGKTAAYAIPLVAHLINNTDACALVVTPTRELATQALDVLKQLIGKDITIKHSLIIGGDPINKQLMQLKNKPRLIVGTPGRINDHLNRKTLKLWKTDFIVFDETDRMLDLGFSEQLEEIERYLPKQRQTLMFSATMPSNIVKLANSYLNDPEHIAIGSTVSPSENVKQEIIKTTDSEKYNVLLEQLENYAGSHIVFVKTKSGADKLAGKLNNSGHKSESIHGDLRQRQREKVIKSFRDYKHRILVATDVAARGIDIPHLQCVVNYDLPQCPEDYIHRVGRTGRAGASGIAVSLLTNQDSAKWKAICKLIGSKAANENEMDDFLDKRPSKKSSRGSSFKRDKGPFSKSSSRNSFVGNDRGSSESIGSVAKRSPSKKDKVSSFRGDEKRNFSKPSRTKEDNLFAKKTKFDKKTSFLVRSERRDSQTDRSSIADKKLSLKKATDFSNSSKKKNFSKTRKFEDKLFAKDKDSSFFSKERKILARPKLFSKNGLKKIETKKYNRDLA